MEEEKHREAKIVNNFYAPIGQYIEHVEHNHFGMDSEGNFQFGGKDGKGAQQQLFPDLPTSEQMAAAVLATYQQGLWWSNRSWAVVYRVYQMKGYMGGFTQFVREVQEWPVQRGFECNYDAIQKPITSGMLAGPPEQWEKQGAQRQAVALAQALLDRLSSESS